MFFQDSCFITLYFEFDFIIIPSVNHQFNPKKLHKYFRNRKTYMDMMLRSPDQI